MGRYETAADAFVSAIDLNPDFFSSYCNLAVALNKIRRINEKGRRHLIQGLVNQIFTIKQRHGILEALGNMPESSREWNHVIFGRCVVPAIAQALEKGDFLSACEINHRTTLTFAQQPHTSEQWRYCHEITNPMFIAAGEAIRQTLPPLRLPSSLDVLPSLAFIIDQSVATGSGAKVLCALITGLILLNPQKLVPVVYAFDKIPKPLRQQYLKLGVRVVDTIIHRDPHSSDDDLLQRLKALRQQLQEDQVSAVLYPGTYEAFPCLAASMGLAPVQIYLSLGFRSIFIPMIDGYVTTGSPVKSKKKIEGKSWRTGSVPHEDIYPPNDGSDLAAIDDEVRLIRQEKFSQYKVILGTLARPQKLENPLFIETLAGILHANPEAVFLWFGPENLPSVGQMMVEQGISERCLFQGWADIKIYAKLLDIHIDSFPFPTALAMLDTMSAATASVWMEEDSEIGVGSNVMPLIRGEVGTRKNQEEIQEIFRYPKTGELLALCADSPEEYIAYVQHLIDDMPFRKAVGAAGRRYMEHFCHDPSVAARAYAEHFIEIIGEKEKLKT